MLLNIIFIAFITISFIAYFYYKTKQFRSTLPIRTKWYKAKAGVALGLFLIFFGINAVIIYQSAVSYIVAIIFFLVGAFEAYNNFKRAKHEGKFVKEEYELNKNL